MLWRCIPVPFSAFVPIFLGAPYPRVSRSLGFGLGSLVGCGYTRELVLNLPVMAVNSCLQSCLFLFFSTESLQLSAQKTIVATQPSWVALLGPFSAWLSGELRSLLEGRHTSRTYNPPVSCEVHNLSAYRRRQNTSIPSGIFSEGERVSVGWSHGRLDAFAP